MQYSLLVLLASPLLALAAALPQDTVPIPHPQHPPTDQVFIEGVTWAGSGCPAGSVATAFAADLKTVTVIFDAYIASIGPNIPITENRKNCQLNIKLRYPQGWSYTIYNTNYRGFVQLDKDVTAVQKSTYYFAGETKQTSLQSVWYGPRKGEDYLFTDTLKREAMVWSRCGASTTLNINTQLRLSTTNKKASGLITTDSIDHKVKHIVGIQWKYCDK